MAEVGCPLRNLLPIRSSFEQELQLIREAIAMVSSGRSPRVVLAGIRHAEILLDPARRLAIAYGVEVTPLRRADQGGTDLSVGRVRE